MSSFTNYDAMKMLSNPIAPLPSRLDIDTRWMIRRDMPYVLEIARESNPHATEDDIYNLLVDRTVVAKVVEYREKIIGYIVFQLKPETVVIKHLTVAIQYQRRSIASQLVAEVEGKAERRNRTLITATVDEYNLPAQLFLRSRFFDCVGVVTDTGELRFVKNLT